MTHNRAFWKALHSLAHPLSILAILLLLLNDHWLRYAHPSWLTGKLGDFTWLVFAPFITALLFSWLIPRTWKRHSELVGWLSIGFIGVWFATAKTIPFVRELTTQTLYAIVGWEGQLRLDVTDLLTIPALLISWYIWRESSDEKVSLKPLAYIAFGLGMLGTLASDGSAYTDWGITKICYTDELLVIQTRSLGNYYHSYESSDGGLSWRNNDQWNRQRLECKNHYDDTFNIADGLSFRWIPDKSIQISKDIGKTWTTEYELTVLQEQARAVRHIVGQPQPDLVIVKPSPISAYYDTPSGNVIFTMGWNGLLVRTSQGDYHWITLGQYGLHNIHDLTLVYPVLQFEFWLAIALFILIAINSHVVIHYYQVKTQFILLAISWLGFVLLVFALLINRLSMLYISPISLMGVASFCYFVFLILPLSVPTIFDFLLNFRSLIIPIALAGISNGALFIFPFILWTQGRIPRYVTAYVFAIFLTLLGLYATRIYLKRILPVLEPEKLKNDDIEKDKKQNPA